MPKDEKIKIKFRTKEQRNYPLMRNTQPSNQQDQDYIADVDDNKEIDFNDDKHIWVKRDNWEPFKLLQGWERKCVEAYCCGWLAYFDLEVEDGKEKHQDKKDSPFIHSIYFDWKDDEIKGLTTVQIYINPKPIDLKRDEISSPSGQTISPASPPKPPPPPMG